MQLPFKRIFACHIVFFTVFVCCACNFLISNDRPNEQANERTSAMCATMNGMCIRCCTRCMHIAHINNLLELSCLFRFLLIRFDLTRFQFNLVWFVYANKFLINIMYRTKCAGCCFRISKSKLFEVSLG